MKKVLFFSLMLLALVACKNEESKTDPENPQTDVRDAFVGTYDLEMVCVFKGSCSNETVDGLLPDSIPYTVNDTMTISKDASDATKVIVKSKYYESTGLVSGTHLILESETNPDFEIDLGEVTGIGMLEGYTLPLSYTMVHKTGDLNNNVLTWHTDANGNGSISIPLLGSITFEGSATIENTATKK